MEMVACVECQPAFRTYDTCKSSTTIHVRAPQRHARSIFTPVALLVEPLAATDRRSLRGSRANSRSLQAQHQGCLGATLLEGSCGQAFLKTLMRLLYLRETLLNAGDRPLR